MEAINSEGIVTELEQKERNYIVTLIVSIGIPFLVYFIVKDLISGNYISAGATLPIMLLIIFGLPLIRKISDTKDEKAKYFRVFNYLFLISIGITITYFIAYEGYSRVPWFYIIPSLAFLMLGHKAGLILTTIFLSMLAAFNFFVPITEPVFIQDVRFRFFVSVIFITVISYFLERWRYDYKSALIKALTEQKETEKDLHRHQKMLARTEKITHVGSWEWEIETDTVSWSEELYRIFQLDPNEKPPNWAEHPKLYHPEDFEKLRKAVEKVVADGTPYTLELRALRKDGEIRNCLAHGYPERNSDGQVVRLFGALHDITERKRAEDALRQSEEKYRKLYEDAAIGIFHSTFEGRFLDVNPALAKMLGYETPQEVVDSIYSIAEQIYVKPQVRDEVIAQSLAKGKTIKLENLYRRKDGSEWNAYLHLRHVCDSNGQPIYLEGFVEDITKRKQAQDALLESEEKYRLLVETANEAIFIAQDEIIKFPNPKALEITGYSEDELATIPFVHLIHPEDRQMVVERYRQRLEGKNPPSDYAFRIINKAGSELWLQINATPTTWEGRPATINLVRDITEQRKLEEQVRQSQKMESIGTLAGGIAHEFNNMLGIIIGNTELALDDIPEWNPAADCIQEIRTASLRAKDVVGKLLSVARKTPEFRKPIQIRSIVDESLGLLRKTIPASIEIRSNLACTTETILADPTEINQVLLNLCNNSVHAMVEGKGGLEVTLDTITLDSRASDSFENIGPGDYVKLTVSDDGIGIQPGILDRIFDPYFTTKDVDEGLGMGLAVVHGILKKHEGAIKVESEVGKGTTVEVLFPLIEEQPVAKMEEADTTPTGTERILFIDDEASLVKMVTQMLDRSGYAVVGMTSSSEALNVFKESPDRFDLVITDMAMPEIPGDELARQLIQVRPDIPIILCTGHSDRMDETKAIGLGIKAFVMKPISAAELAKTIRKVLDEAEG